MTKQVHIRLEEDIYSALAGYSANKGQSVQETVSGAIKQMLVKAKNVPICTAEKQYTFIDLFAGIGGICNDIQVNEIKEIIKTLENNDINKTINTNNAESNKTENSEVINILKEIDINNRLMIGQVRPSRVLVIKHRICDFIWKPPIEVLNSKKLIDQNIVSVTVSKRKAKEKSKILATSSFIKHFKPYK